MSADHGPLLIFIGSVLVILVLVVWGELEKRRP